MEFGEKKVENLLQSITKSKQKPLDRLLTALGIRGVGSVSAYELSIEFSSLDKLNDATIEKLEAIPGIGPNIATNIKEWLNKEKNQKILVKLRKAGVWPSKEIDLSTTKSSSLTGLTFVISGTLKGFNRESIKTFISEHGGKVVNSISKKTDFLILGENPGSKQEKARSLNINMISEEELLRMCL